MRLVSVIITLSILTISQLFSIDKIEFTTVGPGGGGAMYVPAISPHNPNLMFISCDMGGVYRSTDAGASWNMINTNQLVNSNLMSPVFHCSDPNIIWDENNDNIMRSTDAGLTWADASSLPRRICAMICLKSEPFTLIMLDYFGCIYRSTDGIYYEYKASYEGVTHLTDYGDNVWVANTENVWHSNDRGITFNSISIDNLDNTAIMDIAVTESNVYVLQESQLLKSNDNGQTWQIAMKASTYDRGEFTFLRAVDNYVWVTTGGGGTYQTTALLSKDNGINFSPVFFCNSSWDDISNHYGDWLSLDFNCGWGGPATGFCISNTNPATAIWTDNGRALITNNAGETWEPIFTKYADVGAVSSGKKWESIGLEVTSSWDIFVNPNDSNNIRAAYTDIGGSVSNDRGESWLSTVNTGIPSNWFNTNYDLEYDSATAILWGAFSGVHDIPGGWSYNTWNRTGAGGICFSTNYGNNWQAVKTGGLIEKPVTSIAIDYSSPSSNRIVYAAVWSNGVWKSTDGGINWIRVSNGLDCGDGTCTNDGPNTHILEVKVHSDGTVFALKTKYLRGSNVIINDGGLWKSEDKGNTWTCISKNVSDCPPNNTIDLLGEHSWADPISFEIDPNDKNHIFVGAQNCNNGKVQGGLYETIDGGANWNRILETYCAFRMTKSKYYKNRYYLATNDGIMVKEENTNYYKVIPEFPFKNITRITEDPFNKEILWINTFGGGIWKANLNPKSSSIEIQTPKNNINTNVYPNPFTDYLNISTENMISINIFDIYGREILNCQTDSYIWKPDNDVVSGTYIIKTNTKTSSNYTRVVYINTK